MSPAINSTATLAEKIANVQAMRWSTADSVKRLISRNGWIKNGVVAQDDKGFYVGGEIEIHPAIAALPTQAEVDAHKAANPVPVVESAPKAAPVRNVKNGACDLIRTWAKANPDATPAQGVAQFPDLNPSTVKIQMRKVRLGQV